MVTEHAKEESICSVKHRSLTRQSDFQPPSDWTCPLDPSQRILHSPDNVILNQTYGSFTVQISLAALVMPFPHLSPSIQLVSDVLPICIRGPVPQLVHAKALLAGRQGPNGLFPNFPPACCTIITRLPGCCHRRRHHSGGKPETTEKQKGSQARNL